ncbi:MAG: hypothetical protein ABIH00_04230 [Armatimonadota bacterium]
MQIINTNLSPKQYVAPAAGAVYEVNSDLELARPFMEKLVSFCRGAKDVPEDVRESAKNYERIENNFTNKWKSTSLNSSFDVILWKFFNKEKHEDYTKNYEKEKKEYFAARKDLLVKFCGWGKQVLNDEVEVPAKTIIEVNKFTDAISKAWYLLNENDMKAVRWALTH